MNNEFKLIEVDDRPEPYKIREDVLYNWRDEGFHYVIFRCPCGCRRIVYIPCRIPGARSKLETAWNCVIDNGLLTLTPSIQSLGACRSHYYIVQNKVRWCEKP